MAAVGQLQQRPPQRLKRIRLAPEFLGPGGRQGLHLGAGAVAVAPQAEEIADVLDREAEIARIGDEPQAVDVGVGIRSEGHTSELQSLMRNSYAVFCLNKNT